MAHDRFKKWISCLSFNLILYINGGFSDFLCPSVADMDSTVQLTCIFSGPANLFYNNPNGVAVATCARSDESTQCLSNGNNRRFNGTVVNTTHSFLEINDVQMSDAGDWTCEDQTNTVKRNCSLTLRQTPTCSITSDRDITELYAGDEITLSVNIDNYFCSSTVGFILNAGDATLPLFENGTVDTNQSKSETSTFELTESHFGSLNVGFICNNVQTNVSCQGKKVLVKQNFTCTITMEKGTDEEISLTVDIKKYHCSRPAEFMLETGSTKVELNEKHRANESVVVTSAFNLTDLHLGPVNVIFLCNDISRRFMCDGVQVLTSRNVANNMKGSGNGMIVIIAGAAAAVFFVILVIVIIVVVCVVKKRRRSAKKDNFADIADNVNTRPKNIRVSAPGAYEDIGDVSSAFGNYGYEKEPAWSKNDIEMVVNEGYMSCDDVKISERSYDSGLPETPSTFSPGNVYTNVNQKPKV